MRALCGSIITAGALIGLGLSALGVGTRYQNLAANDPASITYLKWVQLDTPMMLIIVVLLGILDRGTGHRVRRPGLPPRTAALRAIPRWRGGCFEPGDALSTAHSNCPQIDASTLFRV